jgi:hypothetical protein
MLNRRSFLKRFGIGVTAALALASLPASAVEHLSEPEAAKRIACEYLRKVYNEWAKAHGNKGPSRMECGVELFEAFEGELIVNQRFTVEGQHDGTRYLAFKGSKLSATGHGWRAECFA